jgi:hypothetical protein
LLVVGRGEDPEVDDLRADADQIGRELKDEEYDVGNPGLLIERASDELGQKASGRPHVEHRAITGRRSQPSLR